MVKRSFPASLRLLVKGVFQLVWGSVIMKTIAEIYGGKIEVTNRRDSDGAVLGASVVITLRSK